MNKQILAALSSLAVVATAFGTQSTYVNNNTLEAPPQAVPVIDADSFVNNALFILDLALNSTDDAPYATKNTRYYTNNYILSSSTGFRFDLHTNTDYTATPNLYATNAEVLYNDSGATINAGGLNVPGLGFTNMIGTGALGTSYASSVPKLQAWANQIINRGTIEVGVNGLLSLRGKKIDLANSQVVMEGDGGQIDGYWGIGAAKAFSPGNFGDNWGYVLMHSVTNRFYQTTYGQVSSILSAPYENVIQVNPSNNLYQAVYLQGSLDSSISNNVYFLGNDIMVEWLWNSTNIVTDQVTQDRLELTDNFFDLNGALSLWATGTAAPNTGYRPTYTPTNMYVFYGQGYNWGYGNPAVQGGGLINYGTANVTNAQYKAYQAQFLASSDPIGEGAGQSFTNARGRIELFADKNLDLSGCALSSLNTLVIKATNNYVTDQNTRLLTYAADLDLGSTNCPMTVSNLMAPTCPRLVGNVNVYSTHWTTVNNGITNEYHVLLVDSSSLVHAAATKVQNLTLHNDNVVVSDVLNVVSNLTIDAKSLTITTNGPDALAPCGAINLLSGNPLDATALPRLKYFTNWGYFQVANSATFGSANLPYFSFVNHGAMTNRGSTYIYANNFENTGAIDAGPSLLSIQATTACLTNGSLTANSLDVTLAADKIVATNTYISAGKRLTISANQWLDDGGPTASNFWAAGTGGVTVSLPSDCLYASLLGTTISNGVAASATATIQWPGRDFGRSIDGYVGNAALGKLALSGGASRSKFVLQGAQASGNALYVDCLELRGTAAGFNGSSFSNITVMPGMKIYYAQALVVDTNGVAVSKAQRFNGANNGAFVWVAGYAGTFSSVNVTNPADGSVYSMNAALRYSTDFNSRKTSEFAANADLQFPLFVPSEYSFTVQPTNAPAPGVVLSWKTIGFATNSVYYKADLQSTNWLMLTNFVSPSVYSLLPLTTQVFDPAMGPNRMYRVRVEPQLP